VRSPANLCFKSLGTLVHPCAMGCNPGQDCKTSLRLNTPRLSFWWAQALLGSDLIRTSSEERSLLKNLGSWLGRLTIGRNQPLLSKGIDPKALIIEAYEKGLMIAIIPFTSKVRLGHTTSGIGDVSHITMARPTVCCIVYPTGCPLVSHSL